LRFSQPREPRSCAWFDEFSSSAALVKAHSVRFHRLDLSSAELRVSRPQGQGSVDQRDDQGHGREKAPARPRTDHR
jgi:hypothetical protein